MKVYPVVNGQKLPNPLPTESGGDIIDLSRYTFTEYWVDSPCIVCVDGAEARSGGGRLSSGGSIDLGPPTPTPTPTPNPNAAPAEFIVMLNYVRSEGEVKVYDIPQVTPPGNYTVQDWEIETQSGQRIPLNAVDWPEDAQLLQPGQFTFGTSDPETGASPIYIRFPDNVTGTFQIRLSGLEQNPV